MGKEIKSVIQKGLEAGLGKEKLETGFAMMLEGLHQAYGLDITNENFRETPQRVAKAYLEMNKGIDTTEVENILKQNFPSDYKGMVILDKIQTYSLCPHHFLPVRYIIHFGYIPNGKVLGLSKIPRFIKLLSQRPALQEDFTQDIIKMFNAYVKPLGCAVVIKGWHGCMGGRGVEMPETATITSEVSGNFTDISVKEEFFKLMNTLK